MEGLLRQAGSDYTIYAIG